MMTVNNRKIKVFSLIALVLALVAAVIRTVLLTKIVEPDTGLYAADAQWGHAFDAGILVLLIAVAVCGRLLFKKVNSPKELDSGSTVTVFGSALCAFMFFSVFVYGIYLMIFTDSAVSLFFKVQIVLCLPCGFNHLLVCAKEKREKSNSQALLAMSVPVMFAIRVVEVFMSTDTQINTSQRSLELLMLCAMMLFYLYESSFLVDKRDDELTKISYANYYIAALCVVVLTCITVVPYLLVSVFWVFEEKNVVMDVLECCVMLYAATRLMTWHD